MVNGPTSCGGGGGCSTAVATPLTTPPPRLSPPSAENHTNSLPRPPFPIRHGTPMHYPPLTSASSSTVTASTTTTSTSGSQQQQPTALIVSSTSPQRPIPFFIREIYKAGYLKRLHYSEKKSSAISKLLGSDRFWVVFSVHDDVHPFLELWHDASDISVRPPSYVFPLALCQHISPSLISAGVDEEWTFVVNFETVAIRFAANTSTIMNDWIEALRSKLSDMGVLNRKGNLYTQIPASQITRQARNPMSPLPSPPSEANQQQQQVSPLRRENESQNQRENSDLAKKKRLSIVDASDEKNQSFRTSIYLNQTPPATPQQQREPSTTAVASTAALTSTSAEVVTTTTSASSTSTTPVKGFGGARPKTTTTISTSAKSKAARTTSVVALKNEENENDEDPANSSTLATSTVYLNKPSPTRHVTVIPINKGKRGQKDSEDKENEIEPNQAEDPASNYDDISEADSDPHYTKLLEPPLPPPRPDNLPSMKTNNKISAKEKLNQTLSASVVEGSSFQKSLEGSSFAKALEGSSGSSSAGKIPRVSMPSPKSKRRQRNESTEGISRNFSSPQPPLLPPQESTKNHRVYRRASEKRVTANSTAEKLESRKSSNGNPPVTSTPKDESKTSYNIQQRVRRKTQRSSSLGPLLDEAKWNPNDRTSQASQAFSNQLGQQNRGNTNSLESIDSNPRNVHGKGGYYYHQGGHHVSSSHHSNHVVFHHPNPEVNHNHTRGANRVHGGGGAVPRRPLLPPLHFPPHIPLPGLTCQIVNSNQPNSQQQSALNQDQQQPPTQPSSANQPSTNGGGGPSSKMPSHRELQLSRLRQEMIHPSGVRLTLRKRDCHNSIALIELFGFVWVAGWKQREFPVLQNAFHVGDQIISVNGVTVKTVSEFYKLVKQHKSSSAEILYHVEIIVRRLPFAQAFCLRREAEGQPLGIVMSQGAGTNAEIKEIVPGGPAANHGMTAKVRSFDGQSLVPWVITEINGKPLPFLALHNSGGPSLGSSGHLSGSTSNLVDGAAAAAAAVSSNPALSAAFIATRLQSGVGREITVVVQPSDIMQRFKKQLKGLKNHKEYLLA